MYVYDSDHKRSPGVLGAAFVPPQALYFTLLYCPADSTLLPYRLYFTALTLQQEGHEDNLLLYLLCSTLLTCKVDCATDSTTKKDTRPPKTAGIPNQKKKLKGQWTIPFTM